MRLKDHNMTFNSFLQKTLLQYFQNAENMTNQISIKRSYFFTSLSIPPFYPTETLDHSTVIKTANYWTTL